MLQIVDVYTGGVIESYNGSNIKYITTGSIVRVGHKIFLDLKIYVILGQLRKLLLLKGLMHCLKMLLPSVHDQQAIVCWFKAGFYNIPRNLFLHSEYGMPRNGREGIIANKKLCQEGNFTTQLDRLLTLQLFIQTTNYKTFLTFLIQNSGIKPKS